MTPFLATCYLLIVYLIWAMLNPKMAFEMLDPAYVPPGRHKTLIILASYGAGICFFSVLIGSFIYLNFNEHTRNIVTVLLHPIMLCSFIVFLKTRNNNTALIAVKTFAGAFIVAWALSIVYHYA